MADSGVMNPYVAPQGSPRVGPGRIALGAMALALSMFLVFAGSAGAAPVAKNGTVNACYRVKGKAKGAMRVVPAGKKCRRGEKKLAWSVAGPPGASGPAGAKGAAGDNGANGAAGSPGPSNEAALQAKIAGLTLKLEGLEGILQGVTNGDLTGAVGKLSGVTGLQLNETVAALPVVDSLCTQASTLTSQADLLRGVVGGLGLSPALAAIGLLTIPALPTALGPFTCPS